MGKKYKESENMKKHSFNILRLFHSLWSEIHCTCIYVFKEFLFSSLLCQQNYTPGLRTETIVVSSPNELHWFTITKSTPWAM